jgi:hypothetical protein
LFRFDFLPDLLLVWAMSSNCSYTRPSVSLTLDNIDSICNKIKQVHFNIHFLLHSFLSFNIILYTVQSHCINKYLFTFLWKYVSDVKWIIPLLLYVHTQSVLV